MDIALKEWASLIEALSLGRQIALLRKGGIVEAARRGFELRHREFLLFPTWEHQHARLLQPQFQTLVTPPVEGSIRFTLLAQVDEALPAPASRDTLLAASGHFIWNEDFVHQRYDYRPDLPLWLILLRCFRLPEVLLPDRPSYAGCKSWVNLSGDVDVSAARPVLEDTAYQAARRNLVATLEQRASA